MIKLIAFVCTILAVMGISANAASPTYVSNGGLAKANSVASITPALPKSPKVGDLLVLQVGVGDTVDFSISPPSVWTSLGTQSYAGYTAAIYWAVYTTGMTTPTVSWAGQDAVTAVISEFTGVSSSPIGAAGTISFDNWGNHTSTAITTTHANSLVLLSDIAANFPNLTKPSGWTQALALNWAGGSQTLDYKIVASSGASSGSTSSSGADTAWFMQQFEILASGGVPSPTASLTANPASITSGQSSTLTWSSTNATSCTGTGFSTGGTVSGSLSVMPAATTSYSVSCTNGTTSANATATVTVTAPAPTAALTANPTSITSGQSSTLTWSSTNATSCTGTGFPTGNAVSGSSSVSPTTTTSYTVTCTNGSTNASSNATVTVASTTPTASLTANPTSITSGQSSTLTWSSTNSNSCAGTNFSTNNATSGSTSVSPTATTNYSVLCTNGTASASANATVSIGSGSGVSMDVAPGPFGSWLNVKTAYGAVGDGVHDDTNNIQSALSAAQSNGSIVYFPSGTYKVTSTLAILSTTGLGMVGHNPADTILKWAGSSGGMMFNISDWNEGAVERLTFDGNNTAAYLHYSVSAQSSSGLFYLDNVFKNAQYGLLLGSGTTDDAERFILRNTFQNLSIAAISAQSNNALDIWPFYSVFNNNAIGVEGTFGNAFCLFCNFSANTTDIHGGGTVQGTVSWGNYSTGSGHHLVVDGCGGDNGYTIVQDDTVVNVAGSAAPITSACGGAPMLALHNQVGSSTTPSIVQSTGSGNGSDLLGVNNLFTASSGGMAATGTSSRLIETGSTYGGTITGFANTITPATLSTGTVLEPSSATGTAIQTVINTANTTYKGQRPVVHLGVNTYSVGSTITIPSGLDVVIVGDSYGTNLNWTGGASGSVFQCNSPCKAYFLDMRITAPTGVDAVLIGTEDSAGSYVNVWYLAAQNTGAGVLVDALNNTAVNFYGLNTYTAGTNYALSVTGNNTLTAQSRTAIFAGTISNSFPYTGALIGASNCPNLVMRNSWMEKDAYLGTFTCGNISFDAGQFAPSALSPSSYMMCINGFNGKFSMLNFQFSNGGTDAQPPQITGSTANTNVLFGMNWFRLASGPAYDTGWGAGGNTNGLMNWTGANPTPIASDKNGTPSNAVITSMLNQLMTVEPMQDMSTPSGVTAAIVQNVFVQGSAAPLHVKTGI